MTCDFYVGEKEGGTNTIERIRANYFDRAAKQQLMESQKSCVLYVGAQTLKSLATIIVVEFLPLFVRCT